MSKDIWQLTYDGVEFAFGAIPLGVFHTKRPVVSEWDIEIEDKRRPRDDGLVPGEDLFAGQTVAFSLGMLASDREAVEEVRDRVAAVWRAERIRKTPGAMAVLESPRGRIAYGRPRRFTSIDEMAPSGALEAVADFRTMTGAWYGEEQRVSVPFTQAPVSGFTFPITFPLVMTGQMVGSKIIAIGGDPDSPLPTPIKTKIYGPISNAVVQIGPLSIQLTGTIAPTDSVTIDPLFKKAYHANGSSATGMITPKSTRLSGMQLEPGQYSVSLRGNSDSGTARVEIITRNAYASY